MQNNLKKIMRDKGVTQQQIADALGVSRPTISYWSKSESLPAKVAMSLCAFLQVPLSALYGDTQEEDGKTIVYVRGLESVRPGYVRVPIFDVSGSCGNDGDVNETAGGVLVAGAVDLAEWFVRSLPGVVSARSLEIIASSGDSMSPTIEERSLVIVDKAQQAIRADGVYCLRVDGELFIKRIMRGLDGTLTLISDNPRYPQRTIKRSDLPGTAVIGRIVYAFNGREI